MTAPETRWTAETEELVARAEHTFDEQVLAFQHGTQPIQWGDIAPTLKDSYRDRAEVYLTALADAGLVVPPGGVTREQWRFEDIFDDDGLVVSSKYFAEPPPEVKAQWPEKSLRRRTVYTGPWIEVPS